MIFLYSIFLFLFSWVTIHRYKRYKKLDLLKEECTKKYNNRLKRNIIFALFFVICFNIYQYIDIVIDLTNGFQGEYFNLPKNLTGFWEIFIDIGFGGYLLLELPGKIFQFFVRTIFVVGSVFIFHSKYLLNKFIMLPKYLKIILYILSFLNGIYMVSELIDLFRIGSDFLWIIRSVFSF